MARPITAHDDSPGSLTTTLILVVVIFAAGAMLAYWDHATAVHIEDRGGIDGGE